MITSRIQQTVIRNKAFVLVLLLSEVLLSTRPIVSYGQAHPDINKSETVNRLSELLVMNYVDENLGREMARQLERMQQDGAFATHESASSFAMALTTELQKISKDKHLRVRAGAGPPPLGPQSAFGNCRWLNDSTGIVSIVEFAAKQMAQPAIDKCMKDLSSAKRIIIDLRNCRGGSPETVAYLCSFFLSPNVMTNSIYNRVRDETREFYTEKVDGKSLFSTPVTVLTSQKTFSAGEEFAYDMQAFRRARIVGEVTGGAANPGAVFKVNEQFTVFIPTGRVTNPVTKSNWEGKGVQPDVLVAADKAVEVAVSVSERR